MNPVHETLEWLVNTPSVTGNEGRIATAIAQRLLPTWSMQSVARVGNSLVVGYTGWPLAGPASEDREEMLIADVNLSDARRKRSWNDFNQVLRDRRIDLYAENLGADITRGWY